MARVNIDDDIESQNEFWLLLPLVGNDRDRAIGKLVRFFRLTQKPWTRGEGVQWSEITDAGLSEMIDSGWAIPFAGGWTAKGAETHFAWLAQKISAGGKGGRPTKAEVTARLAEDSERLAAETGRNPLALALALALESKATDTSTSPPLSPPAEGDASAPPERERRRTKAKRQPRFDDDALMAVVEAWNEHCGPLRKCAFLTDKRRPVIAARLKDDPEIQVWIEAAKRVARSPFCRGETGGNWIANFDWFIRPDTLTKIQEGNYDGKTTAETPRPRIPQSRDAW